MQSKQNHICALWWFQGFKSLTLEFCVGSSPVVQVASGNLWFSDLAGEWQEEILLENICQGCGAPACAVNYRRWSTTETEFTALLQANWTPPPQCFEGRCCYLVEADIFVHAVKRVPVAMNNTCGKGSRKVRAVQTYLTAERAKRFLNAAAEWCVYGHLFKDIFNCHFWKVTKVVDVSV